MLYLLLLYTNVIKVATLDVVTVNTLVLVTRVLKVETLYTNVYKSQKGKLKSSKNGGDWVKRNGFPVAVGGCVRCYNPKSLSK